MAVIDRNSCRICLSPDSAFANVFGTFQKRSVEKLVLKVCSVELNRNAKLPQNLCENCLSKLLHSDAIRQVCIRNERFLIDLAACETLTEDSSDVKMELGSLGSRDDDCIEEEILIEEVFEKPPVSPSSDEAFELEPYMQINQQSKDLKKETLSSYFCTYCFEAFNTRAKCVYHEKAKHLPKAPDAHLKQLTCDRCAMKFKQKSHLINHLNVVHLRIKRYQCTICGFAMYSKTHHTNHMKTHNNIKEFKCQQCGKDFSRKESLLVHQRTHTNERPYKCRYCERSYTAHTDLKRHIFNHTQVHPYICRVDMGAKTCLQGFFLKRLLLEHIATLHPGTDTSSWLTGKTYHNF